MGISRTAELDTYPDVARPEQIISDSFGGDLSSRKAAELVGVSTQTVSGWLNKQQSPFDGLGTEDHRAF